MRATRLVEKVYVPKETGQRKVGKPTWNEEGTYTFEVRGGKWERVRKITKNRKMWRD